MERGTIGPTQFAMMLLRPRNDAIAPLPKQPLTEPLAHYWSACSHNSYIVGDQLTGLSSADAYRRQLVQGYRHLEIDCWDGNRRPIVTHGHTLCTVEKFEDVARAIAECAFLTSDLPVILSLEMHCSVGQQFKLACDLIKHLGPALLTYETFASMDDVSLGALRGRVLVKGKLKNKAVREMNEATMLNLQRSLLSTESGHIPFCTMLRALWGLGKVGNALRLSFP
ncbi:hypothetical protein AB1Y20_007462 [Prymnesium parvum]|uniref:Phosphoinositide phospholipase C n=1 Tax=Prymnesium parvum TaxID=97485 RepID=A0AB34IW54_PRYPA